MIQFLSWQLDDQTSTDQFVIDTNPARLDIEIMHGFLKDAYWCRDIPIETLQRAVNGSLNFGLYTESKSGPVQVGYARAVTDRATFSYLSDVFVLPPWRGRGFGRWLVECALAHPELQGLRSWMLATSDAHDLYRRLGFTSSTDGKIMTRTDLDIYRQTE